MGQWLHWRCDHHPKNCGEVDPGLLTVQYAKPVPTELANFTARRFDLSKRSTGLLNMTCKKKGGSRLPVQFKTPSK